MVRSAFVGAGGAGSSRITSLPWIQLMLRAFCHTQVPLDPALSRAAEEGRSAFEGAGAAGRSGALPALRAVIDAVLAALGEPPSASGQLGGGGPGGAAGGVTNGAVNSGQHSMEGLTGVPAQ